MFLNTIDEMPRGILKNRDLAQSGLSYDFNVDSPLTTEGEFSSPTFVN